MSGLWRREGLERPDQEGTRRDARTGRGGAEEGSSHSGSAETTVRAWGGKPTTTDGAFADSKAPLAGFSIIEAADLDEVIRLVAGTPCARAKGAIEIRPIMAINDFELIR
jgi:hypothetical protein